MKKIIPVIAFYIILLIGCNNDIQNTKGMKILKFETWGNDMWKYWASPIDNNDEPRMIYFYDKPEKFHVNDTIYFRK